MLKFWEKDPPMVSYNICKNKENPKGQWSHLRISLYAMALKVVFHCEDQSAKLLHLLHEILKAFLGYFHCHTPYKIICWVSNLPSLLSTWVNINCSFNNFILFLFGLDFITQIFIKLSMVLCFSESRLSERRSLNLFQPLNLKWTNWKLFRPSDRHFWIIMSVNEYFFQVFLFGYYPKPHHPPSFLDQAISCFDRMGLKS